MPQTTTYGYDAHGNIVKKTLPNGETITQTYDALNRVTKIEGQKPSAGGLLYRYGYRYDLAGNIVHIREDYSESPASWREIQQTYDRAYRLISEQCSYSPDGILGTDEGNRIISYRYDEADNRTQKATFRFSEQEDYSYNTLNQLTHLAADERSVDYEYDLNGNRILRTEDTTITGYVYDYDNRLVGVTNNTLEPAYAYNYDYRTRRVGIEAAPDTGSPATTTLSFSGGNSVQEYLDSTLNVEYIRGSDLGGGIGGILYTIRGGEPSFTHYNSRGDVVAKTNSANTLTYQAAYEAYGMHSEETGSTLDRQKANTKDEDPTGLLNEGFRYRDLETGEFITRDPVGFVDGPNLYTYVRQNPWTKFDPEGLEDQPLYPLPKNAIPSAVTITRTQASTYSFHFEVPVRFTGPGATEENVCRIIAAIEKGWTGQKGRYDVTYRVVDPKPGQPTNTLILYNNNETEMSRGNNIWSGGAMRPDGTWVHLGGHFVRLTDPYEGSSTSVSKEERVERTREGDPMMNNTVNESATERNVDNALYLESARRRQMARERAQEAQRQEELERQRQQEENEPASEPNYGKHWARGSPRFEVPKPPEKKKSKKEEN